MKKKKYIIMQIIILLQIIFLILSQTQTQLIEPTSPSPQYYSQSLSDTNPVLDFSITDPTELAAITDSSFSFWFKLNYYEKQDTSNLSRTDVFLHMVGVYLDQTSPKSCLNSKRIHDIYYNKYQGTEYIVSESYEQTTTSAVNQQTQVFVDTLDGQWVFVYSGLSISQQKISVLIHLQDTDTDHFLSKSVISQVPYSGFNLLAGACGGLRYFGKFYNIRLYTTGSNIYLGTQTEIKNYYFTSLAPDQQPPKLDNYYYQFVESERPTVVEQEFGPLEQFGSYKQFALYGWVKLDFKPTAIQFYQVLSNWEPYNTLQSGVKCGDRQIMTIFQLGGPAEGDESFQNAFSNCQQMSNVGENIDTNNPFMLTDLQISNWIFFYYGYNYETKQSHNFAYYSADQSTYSTGVLNNRYMHRLQDPYYILSYQQYGYDAISCQSKNIFIKLGPGSFIEDPASQEMQDLKDQTGCPSFGFIEGSKSYTSDNTAPITDATAKTCQQCSNACNGCTTTVDNCEACSDTNRDFSNGCQCKTGFYNIKFEPLCGQCQYFCSQCEHYDYKCTACSDSNRDINNGCNCIDTFFNEGTNPICQACIYPCINCTSLTVCSTCHDSINRNIAPTCTCSDGYYSLNESCVACSYQCATCSDFTVCTQCKTTLNRGTFPTCVCDDTFYDDETQCQACQYPCGNCTGINPGECLSCSSTVDLRIDSSTCGCMDNYYDDGSDCIQCNFTCNLCSLSQGCLANECKSNRINDSTNLQCKCPTDTVTVIDHLAEGYTDTILCTTCTQSAYTQNLIALDTLKLEFTIELEVNTTFQISITDYSKELCNEIFEDQTKLIFGDIPLCKIQTVTQNSRQESSIYIQFSYIQSYTPNSVDNVNFQFKTDFLRQVGCLSTQFINEFLLLEQIQTYTTVQPVAIVSKPNFILVCQDLEIEIVSIQNDGKQYLKSINWQISTDGNTDISDLITQVNTDYSVLSNNSQNFYLPKSVLEGNRTYKIVLTITNYLDSIGTNEIMMQLGSDRLSQINFIENPMPLIIEPWEEVFINFKVRILQCQPEGLKTKDDKTLLYYEINQVDSSSQSANLIQQLEASYFIEEQQNQYSFQVEQYQYNYGQSYYFDFVGKLDENDTNGQKIQLQFFVQQAKLLHFIKDGNRVQSYNLELTLEVEFKDLNVIPDQQQTGFTQLWECKNLSDNTACQNAQGNSVTFDQNLQIQTFQKKYFPEYSTLEFIHTLTKGSDTFKTSSIIIVTEQDAPKLTVNLPEQIQIQSINTTDDLQFQIEYPKNSDELTLSLMLYYNFDKVAIKQFNFKTFSFKIRDLFDNFITNNNQMLIKISCYDLEYLMPATSSFQININPSPTGGQLQIAPLTGFSVETQFTIQAQNYQDIDFPLQYQFQFYKSTLDEKKSIFLGQSPTQLLRYPLKSQSQNNQITTFLPSQNDNVLDENQNNVSGLIVQVIVIDNKGAKTNSTATIEVLQNPSNLLNSIQQKLTEIDNYKEQTQNTQLSIMTQELVKFIKNPSNLSQNQSQLSTISNNINQKIQEIGSRLNNQVDIELNQQAKNQILEIINQVDIVDNYLYDQTYQTLQNSINLINMQFQQKQQQSLQSSQSSRIQRRNVQNQEVLTKNLDGLGQLAKIVEKRRRMRLLQENELQQKSQDLVANIKKVGETFSTSMLPNQDTLIYQNEVINTNIQKTTPKSINSLFQNSIDGFLGSEQDENNQILNPDAIYNTQYTDYVDNSLFKNQNGFKYAEQLGNKIIDMDISQINEQNGANTSQLDLQGSLFELILGTKNNDEESKDYEQVCLQKLGDEWDDSSCNSILTELLEIQCKCASLDPITSVLDVDNIFSDKVKELQQALSTEGLEKLLSFEFHKSIFFYTFIFMLTCQCLIIKQGYNKDKKESKFKQYIDEKAKKIKEKEKKVTKDKNIDIENNQENQKLNKENIENLKSEYKNNQVYPMFKNNKNQNQITDADADADADQNQENNSDNLSSQRFFEKAKKRRISIRKQRTLKQQQENIEKNTNKIYKQNFLIEGNQDDEEILKISSKSSDQSKKEKNTQNTQSQKISQNQNNNQKQKSIENISSKDKQIIASQNTLNHDDLHKQFQEEVTSKKSLFQSFWFFHEVFWIYFVYHVQQTRPQRYLAYFLKSILAMAFIFFFYEKHNIYVQLAMGTSLCLLSSIIIVLLSKIIFAKFIVIKILGIILYVVIYGLSIYIILIRSAFMGLEEANEWTVSYLMSYFLDISFQQSLVAIIKNLIVQNFHKGDKLPPLVAAIVLEEQYIFYQAFQQK